MILSSSNFLHIPYTSDLTEAGIVYALRSLSHEKILYHRMTRMVAGVAVELAFRRYLSRQNIPYEVATSLPLMEHDRHDVMLQGHRCDIKSFFISYPSQIEKMRRTPEILLHVPALVPSDVDAGEGHADADLYIFAFVTGSKDSIESGQPHYFVNVMPERWRSPAHWNPLGEVILKSESNLRVEVEIGGQNESRDYITRSVILQPKKRTRVEESFHSISSIHIKNIPTARLGISIQKTPYIIAPGDWKNIWVSGADILFAGYLTRGDFRQRAKFIPPKTRVFQYHQTRVKNLAVPISSLKPLQELFEKNLRSP